MDQVQEVWSKLNARERLTGSGALVIVLAWIIGLVARGFGVGSLGLVGAIAVLIVLYLKYANPTIQWPVAVPIITLAISAIVALFAVLTLIDWLGYLNVLGVLGLIALALYVIGALLMAYGSWQEYQVEKPALPNMSASSTSSAPPAAPPANPPAPPAAPPPSDTQPPSGGSSGDTA